LLKNDGWQADAWNTDERLLFARLPERTRVLTPFRLLRLQEFAALRPGARSCWRVAGGGAAARRGGRSLLICSRKPDASGGGAGMEFADGPYEQH